ncbi:MAG TPA: hypothetical protein VGF32_01050 [Streptosporangiaceae bacterium]
MGRAVGLVPGLVPVGLHDWAGSALLQLPPGVRACLAVTLGAVR